MERLVKDRIKKSRIPARLDLAQSGTGLVLGLFMWVHMLLVGSILLGKGSFNFVAKTMELSFLSDTGHGYPSAVFFAVLGVFSLFIIHAALGVRKFPISWKQHTIIRSQMGMMNHSDTNLWYWQVVTGFFMFFLGSVHLFVMLTHPGQIDPYLSADRVFSSTMWPLYLVLLFCVEVHGTIGLYRLCMKWGWFAGTDPAKSREKLKMVKNRATIFFLSIGVLALLVFFIIGWGHSDRVGEPYNTGHTAVEDSVAPGADPVDAGTEEATEVEASEETGEELEEATEVEAAEEIAEEAVEAAEVEASEETAEESVEAADDETAEETAVETTEAPSAPSDIHVEVEANDHTTSNKE
ncbi:MAG: fumarate reductase cytochrome b subunit [Desulfobacterium sp.]|nr:fumarate reductase cytochrome b subunit [Desulfobacterium sp.]